MGGLIVAIVLFVLVTIALLINAIQIVSLQNIGEGIAVGPRTVTNNPIHTVAYENTVHIFRPNISREFSCRDDHVLSLGEQEYISVCYYQKSVIIDIRTFLDRPQGLYPTVKGIHLNEQQWKSLKRVQRRVDNFIREINKG